MAGYQTYTPSQRKISDEEKRLQQNAQKANSEQYKDFTYDEFKTSDRTNNYQKELDTIRAQRPGEMTFTKQEYLDDIINSIRDRKPFSYDLNGDMLYQQYKDQYLTQGKLAMKDTMGQAATMTGGYGNSYAQSVGQQAYQGYLQQLNDKVPELYQLAYNKYLNEGDDLYKQKSMLDDEYTKEYNAHRDRVSDWQYDADSTNGLYQNSLADDKDRYQLGYSRAKDIVDTYNTNLKSRQDLANQLYENERSYGQSQWAAEESNRQKAIDSANDKLAREREEALSLLTGSGSSSGSSSSAGEDFKPYTYASEDQDVAGNNVFYRDGKKYSFAAGVNPYTGTRNPDAKNGTFGNGYQPNNVNGKKLTSTGMTYVVNGVTQTVWKTSDGKMYVWDGTKNAYQDFEVEGDTSGMTLSANKKNGVQERKVSNGKGRWTAAY